MLFTASAIVGAILIAFTMQPQKLIGSSTFHFARAAAYSLVNVYMIKMAIACSSSRLDRRDLHGDCPTLARDSRLCLGAHSFVRELLYQLDLPRLSHLGVLAQRLHLARQHPQSLWATCKRVVHNRLRGHTGMLTRIERAAFASMEL